MEENLLSPQPDFKLYNSKAILIGTFLGGPLVAGYLTAENFKQLGHNNKVINTWIATVIASIVIFGGSFLIPGIEKIPGYMISLIYTFIVQHLVKHFQGREINEHIENGGQTYSAWRSVWIGLSGLVVTLAIIFGISLLATN